jgi:hypothetical protein
VGLKSIEERTIHYPVDKCVDIPGRKFAPS